MTATLPFLCLTLSCMDFHQCKVDNCVCREATTWQEVKVSVWHHKQFEMRRLGAVGTAVRAQQCQFAWKVCVEELHFAISSFSFLLVRHDFSLMWTVTQIFLFAPFWTLSCGSLNQTVIDFILLGENKSKELERISLYPEATAFLPPQCF